MLPEEIKAVNKMWEVVKFPVVEIFNSIQGEGCFTGRNATFIRLSGCNLQCPWCDTDHTPKLGSLSILEILNLVQEQGSEKLDLIVVTGGEPTIHKNLFHLFAALRTFFRDHKSLQLAMETNGTNPLMLYRLKNAGLVDMITVSPKDNMLDENILDSISVCDEVKVVFSDIATPEIYEPLLDYHFLKHSAFIQPCSENYAPVVEFLKKHPRWRVSVQIQKILNVF